MIRLPVTHPRYLALKYCLKTFRKVTGRVLDVGCGAGVMTKEIKRLRPDFEVYGIDSSPEAIELAKKDGGEVNFRVSDTYHLPFKNDYFSAAFSHHVLEHLKRPGQALAEIARVTKKGGKIYAAVPLEGNWSSIHAFFYKIPAYKKMRVRYLAHVQQYSLEEIKKLFGENGFLITDYYWSGGLVMQTINFFYYLSASFLKLPPSFLTGNDLLIKKRSGYGRWGTIAKRFFYFLVTLESLFIPRVPQEIVHLAGRKK